MHQRKCLYGEEPSRELKWLALLLVRNAWGPCKPPLPMIVNRGLPKWTPKPAKDHKKNPTLHGEYSTHDRLKVNCWSSSGLGFKVVLWNVCSHSNGSWARGLWPCWGLRIRE